MVLWIQSTFGSVAENVHAAIVEKASFDAAVMGDV